MSIDLPADLDALKAERARLESQLDHVDDWRALQQLRARARFGDPLATVGGGRLEQLLLDHLNENPLYRRREAVLADIARIEAELRSGLRRRAAATAPAERDPRAAGVDDLTRIHGIDAGLARQLRGLGIWSFEQIASLMPDDVMMISTALRLGRAIHAQGWIEQAAILAGPRLRGRAEVSAAAPRAAAAETDATTAAPAVPLAPVARTSQEEALKRGASARDVQGRDAPDARARLAQAANTADGPTGPSAATDTASAKPLRLDPAAVNLLHALLTGAPLEQPVPAAVAAKAAPALQAPTPTAPSKLSPAPVAPNPVAASPEPERPPLSQRMAAPTSFALPEKVPQPMRTAAYVPPAAPATAPAAPTAAAKPVLAAVPASPAPAANGAVASAQDVEQALAITRSLAAPKPLRPWAYAGPRKSDAESASTHAHLVPRPARPSSYAPLPEVAAAVAPQAAAPAATPPVAPAAAAASPPPSPSAPPLAAVTAPPAVQQAAPPAPPRLPSTPQLPPPVAANLPGVQAAAAAAARAAAQRAEQNRTAAPAEQPAAAGNPPPLPNVIAVPRPPRLPDTGQVLPLEVREVSELMNGIDYETFKSTLQEASVEIVRTRPPRPAARIPGPPTVSGPVPPASLRDPPKTPMGRFLKALTGQ